MQKKTSEEQVMNEEPAFSVDGQTIHSINPLGMRVLVEVLDASDRSKGGLHTQFLKVFQVRKLQMSI